MEGGAHHQEASTHHDSHAGGNAGGGEIGNAIMEFLDVPATVVHDQLGKLIEGPVEKAEEFFPGKSSAASAGGGPSH